MGIGHITVEQKWFNGQVAITHKGSGNAQLAGLELISTDVSCEEGGHTGTTHFTYEGAVRAMSEDEYVYELDAHMGEVPITAHPRISYLIKKYEAISDTLSVWRFPKWLADGSKSKLFAVTSFLDVRATWRRTYTSKIIPVAFAGRIEEPPGGAAFAEAEAATGQDEGFKYNWLRMPTRAVWKGTVWQITEEWEMSGRGGWVEALYSTECPAGQTDNKSPFKQTTLKSDLSKSLLKPSSLPAWDSKVSPFKQTSL